MKLPSQQLESHLTKNLARIYIVSGDDLLLTQEAIQLIRDVAKKNGYHERTKITVESGGDWIKSLYTDTHSLSLFSEKKIVEIDFCTAKFNANVGKTLHEYIENLPAHLLLIIHTEKVDRKTEQTAWYQALEKLSVCIAIWPIQSAQLPAWLMQRAQKINLKISKETAERIALHTEGNLLSAAQEIEKLSLLQSPDQQSIEDAITDNARFDIFDLVDCALLGDAQRSLRILNNLASEDIDPVLILWALTRELRTLADMQKALKENSSFSTLFSKFRVWEKRQNAVRHFLKCHSEKNCWAMLLDAAQIDRMIKGAAIGNVWDELERLVLKITNIKNWDFFGVF